MIVGTRIHDAANFYTDCDRYHFSPMERSVDTAVRKQISTCALELWSGIGERRGCWQAQRAGGSSEGYDHLKGDAGHGKEP